MHHVGCPTDIETQNGELVCDRCAPYEHTRCGGCGGWYRGIPSCGCVTCDRCGDRTPAEDTIETVGESTICSDCQEFYRRCESCDGWNPDGDICVNGCCGEDCDCEDCLDDGGLDGVLHDWSYKPIPCFHGEGPLFLGQEIEIETPYGSTGDCAEAAYTHLGRLGYLKSDSSICHGFEIVTHPMSYQWAITNFPWKMLTHLEQLGCHVSDSTGIHVHISRAGFTCAAHTFRWMKFIYRNQREVIALARRDSTEWAAFTDDDRRAVKDYAKGSAGNNRYRAINTTNTATFELRVFASSLDPDEVQAALAFAAASVEYTRTLTTAKIINGGGWSWPAFTTWVAERPVYAPLARQLGAPRCAC